MAANGLAGASVRALILVAYWSNHKLVPLSKIGAKPIPVSYTHLDVYKRQAQKRKDWNGLISGFKASDLVFLDESGCNTDMTRRYAYSLGGSRAVDSAPLSKPKNTTILSSLQLDGTCLLYTSRCV